MTIKIFIVDDHAILRHGLRLILEGEPDLTVIGEAENGRDAVQALADGRPDVVLMDIAMPNLNGIETTRQVRTLCPTTQIIILSAHRCTDIVLNALRVGAHGYLTKGSESLELVQAVRAVHKGQLYLSKTVAGQTIEAYLQQSGGKIEEPLTRLSAREREVLQFVVEGHRTSNIADILDLSPETVKTYRSRLMAKLDVKDIPSLVKFAIRQGLTSLE